MQTSSNGIIKRQKMGLALRGLVLALTTWVALGWVALGSLRWSRSMLLGPAPLAPADGIAAVVALAVGASAIWLGVSFTWALTSTWSRRSSLEVVAPRGTPRIVRAWVALVIGTGSIVTGANPAMAAPLTTASVAIDPLTVHGWTPDALPPAPGPEISLLLPAWQPEPDTAVVVRRGDCLWSIVSRALGADATDAEIALAWPQWYAANAEVIGDDPDLILPGQLLRRPAESS